MTHPQIDTNNEELRLEIHAQVNSAAQKQVNAAYTGQTSPIDTAVHVDEIMIAITSRDQQIALAAQVEALQRVDGHNRWYPDGREPISVYEHIDELRANVKAAQEKS